MKDLQEHLDVVIDMANLLDYKVDKRIFEDLDVYYFDKWNPYTPCFKLIIYKNDKYAIHNAKIVLNDLLTQQTTATKVDEDYLIVMKKLSELL